MEDIFNSIPSIAEYINFYFLISFILLTRFFKKPLHSLLVGLLKQKMSKHWAVFIIGTLTALPFWLYFKHEKMILFVSYCVGTTLYDLIIIYIEKHFPIFKKEEEVGPFGKQPQDLKE